MTAYKYKLSVCQLCTHPPPKKKTLHAYPSVFCLYIIYMRTFLGYCARERPGTNQSVDERQERSKLAPLGAGWITHK